MFEGPRPFKMDGLVESHLWKNVSHAVRTVELHLWGALKTSWISQNKSPNKKTWCEKKKLMDFYPKKNWKILKTFNKIHQFSCLKSETWGRNSGRNFSTFWRLSFFQVCWVAPSMGGLGGFGGLGTGAVPQWVTGVGWVFFAVFFGSINSQNSQPGSFPMKIKDVFFHIHIQLI